MVSALCQQSAISQITPQHNPLISSYISSSEVVLNQKQNLEFSVLVGVINPPQKRFFLKNVKNLSACQTFFYSGHVDMSLRKNLFCHNTKKTTREENQDNLSSNHPQIDNDANNKNVAITEKKKKT